jgi:hypothetical protein
MNLHCCANHGLGLWAPLEICVHLRHLRFHAALSQERADCLGTADFHRFPQMIP